MTTYSVFLADGKEADVEADGYYVGKEDGCLHFVTLPARASRIRWEGEFTPGRKIKSFARGYWLSVTES